MMILSQRKKILPLFLSAALIMPSMVMVSCGSGGGGTGGNSNAAEVLTPVSAGIDAVYFGQTHMQMIGDPYFTLVGDRDTLIKAHVVAPGNVAAPTVTATLRLNGLSQVVVLSGPATLPASVPNGRGTIQHSFNNSFTGTIPKNWMAPGLTVEVNAGTFTWNSGSIPIDAPTKLNLTMMDFHFFAQATGNYPVGWETEFEQKLPVAKLTLQRVPNIIFNELAVPPRAGVRATRCTSRADYQTQTGIAFDGEQDTASAWNRTLQNAGGQARLTYFYGNIYNVPAGGQAGGFAGVGNGTSIGIMSHESGHAFGLPHWEGVSTYPYQGPMYGIQTPPNQQAHAGPIWAFDMNHRSFISPIKLGANYYKKDPMQGGGVGDQDAGYILNHFSDYSVFKMSSYYESQIAVWNNSLNAYAHWNTTTKNYTAIVNGIGTSLPRTNNVAVTSILIGYSAVTPNATIIYPPIGPYTSGLIDLFDPRVANDKAAWQATYGGGYPLGCDVSVRIIQGGVEKIYMLNLSTDPTGDPLNAATYFVRALNLPASDGAVTLVELLSTPNVQTAPFPASPTVLTSWIFPVISNG